MTSSQHRPLIFGEAAQTYDVYRPEYPAAAVDHVLALTTVESAVEIGAGTGKATSGFARAGLSITCLEPSPAMATVLYDRHLPGVVVEGVSFERWKGAETPVDLIYAAQAWHWVDHRIAWARAKENLRSGGVLALLWNVPLGRYDRFTDIYERLAPEILAENDHRVRQRDEPKWLEDLEVNGFRSCELMIHPWSVVLTSAGFRNLRSTYSDHMMIPEPRRTAMLGAIEDAVDERGGYIQVEYETRVFSGMNL